MRILILALLLAPEALAQPPYGDPGAGPGERLLRNLEDSALSLGGSTLALASGAATVWALDGVGLPPDVQVVGAYVVGAAGMALGVHGAAQLVGVEGTLRNAMGDAMSGVAIGAPLGIATFLLLDPGVPSDACGGVFCLDTRNVVAVFAGLTVAITIPAMWVLLDYRNDGSAIRFAASGASGPGFALTVGL